VNVRLANFGLSVALAPDTSGEGVEAVRDRMGDDCRALAAVILEFLLASFSDSGFPKRPMRALVESHGQERGRLREEVVSEDEGGEFEGGLSLLDTGGWDLIECLCSSPSLEGASGDDATRLAELWADADADEE